MAEGYGNSYNWPIMNWMASDLSKEWERFYNHCSFTFGFGGPLFKCSEAEKICNLMNFVGDKGREIYMCFDWQNVKIKVNGEDKEVSQKDVLGELVKIFKNHVESKKNPIMSAVLFDRRKQRPEESFDDFVTDLKLLSRGLGLTETELLIRNAIACKSTDSRVRQRCHFKIIRLHKEYTQKINKF